MITRPSQPRIWRTLGIFFWYLGNRIRFILVVARIESSNCLLQRKILQESSIPRRWEWRETHTCIGWREEENSCSKWRGCQKWWESGSPAMRHRQPQNEILQTAVYCWFLSLSLPSPSLSPHIDCDDSRIWINEHFGWFSLTRLHNVDNTLGRFVQRRDTCLFIIKGGLVSGVEKTLAVRHTFLLVREVGSCTL